jgi:hypothetical protein
MITILLLPLAALLYYNLRRWGAPLHLRGIPRAARDELAQAWAGDGQDKCFDRRWKAIDDDYLERMVPLYADVGLPSLSPRIPRGTPVYTRCANIYWGTVLPPARKDGVLTIKSRASN